MTENPCSACTTNHGCCTLKGACGLMLTKDEYDRHFKHHAECLEIGQSNEFYIISSKDGHVCPHYAKSGCRIYHDRPIDCRLYPYVMHRFIKRLQKIKIVFHSNSDCPEKTALFLSVPEATARALVVEFGGKVYGGGKTILVQHEKGAFSRFRIRVESAISRRINRLFLK
jgi:Fe-S-cluster containining protein